MRKRKEEKAVLTPSPYALILFLSQKETFRRTPGNEFPG